MEKLLNTAQLWVPALLYIATCLANYLTEHHSTKDVGVVAGWLLQLIERMSVLSSKGVEGSLKLPLTDKVPNETGVSSIDKD